MFACRGYTLIELMISVAISSILLSILVDIYLTCNKSTQLQQALQTIVSSETRALALLSSEIRKAGSMGCARLTEDFPIESDDEITLTPDNKRQVSATQLTVRYADFKGVVLLGEMKESSTLMASTEKIFKPGDSLMMSDCNHAELFRVASISQYHHQQKITITAPLRTAFSANAEISEFRINTYFVTSDGKQSALYMKDSSGRKELVVTSVSTVQFEEVKRADETPMAIKMAITVVASPFTKTWHGYVPI